MAAGPSHHLQLRGGAVRDGRRHRPRPLPDTGAPQGHTVHMEVQWGENHKRFSSDQHRGVDTRERRQEHHRHQERKEGSLWRLRVQRRERDGNN